jgi:hypothetical protein
MPVRLAPAMAETGQATRPAGLIGKEAPTFRVRR